MVSSPKMPRNPVCRSWAALCRHMRSTLVMTCAAIVLSLGAGQRNLPAPGLGANLDCLPGASKRGRVRQVEIAYGLDGHLVEDGGCGDVDALGDLGVPMAEQLQAEQLTGAPVAGDAHSDAVAAGVVGLVIVGLGLDRDWLEPGRDCLVIAQAGACGRLVEDFHDLGSEA